MCSSFKFQIAEMKATNQNEIEKKNVFFLTTLDNENLLANPDDIFFSRNLFISHVLRLWWQAR